ncbi:MAG TPA: hypothetical protein VHE35_17220 [Kofleriaceae bacterium]|nr:hypothetical protein [Kofleriaceae bacterium]
MPTASPHKPLLAHPTVTSSPRLRGVIGIIGALALAAPGLAHAQPAHRRPAPAPAPTPPPPPPPPPGPDPETKALLDEQAAALAKASEQLAKQQTTLDELAARTAQQAAALEEEKQAAAALAAKLDAERADREAAEAKAAARPVVTSGASGVTVSALVQVDAGWRQSSSDELRPSGDPLNQDRVWLRRGRPRLTAVHGKLSGVAELDVNTVNGAQVRPSAFSVGYQPVPWLKADLGLAKIPFGHEVEQADRDRLFLERSNAARAMFPGEYDLGLEVGGAWKFLRYAVAVQNGEPVGERGYALRDPNQAKDVSARAGAEHTAGKVTVAGGFSFLKGRGFHPGTPATKDVLVWRDLNEDGVVGAGEIQIIPGQAATPSFDFDRFAVGADASFTLQLARGPLTVYGELYVAGNLDRATVIADPIAASRDFRELGWYVAATDAPTAWSAVGVRYDRYDPDADASELRTGMVVPVDQTLSTISVTAALTSPHGRLILQYDHNDNHQGRTTAGVPTRLADDAVTLRAEARL